MSAGVVFFQNIGLYLISYVGVKSRLYQGKCDPNVLSLHDSYYIDVKQAQDNDSSTTAE